SKSNGHEYPMRRRQFIILAGSAVAAPMLAPLAGRAQEPAQLRRVGIVVEGIRTPAYDGFLAGMSDLGYVAGRDYVVEWRFGDGRFLRVLDLVQQFQKLNVDVIFLGGPAM